MSPLPPEHQLHRLVFEDIERFVSQQDLPDGAKVEELMALPYAASLGDIGIGFICLFRRTRPNRGIAMTIQYTVKVGETVVAAMTRDAQEPLYGMLHYRAGHLDEDIAHLRSVLTAPRDYRAMSDDEVKAFAKDAPDLTKKRIRLADAKA